MKSDLGKLIMIVWLSAMAYFTYENLLGYSYQFTSKYRLEVFFDTDLDNTERLISSLETNSNLHSLTLNHINTDNPRFLKYLFEMVD